MDHRDEGLAERRHRRLQEVRCFAITALSLGVAPDSLELRDVAARYEGLFAGASHDHNLNGGQLGELFEHCDRIDHHVGGDRVQLGGVVPDKPADAVIDVSVDQS